MNFAIGRKTSKESLEQGILFFLPNERQQLVDTLLSAIPASERREFECWMTLNGNGTTEQYYLTLLAVAEAASHRGDLSRELMEEIARDIHRGGTMRGILLEQFSPASHRR